MQAIGTANIAAGHEVWRDGVYKVIGPPPNGMPQPVPSLTEVPPFGYRAALKRINRAPLWYRDLGECVDPASPDRRRMLLLGFIDDISGVEGERWVSAGDVGDRGKLKALGAEGIPITGENAPAIIDYLDGCKLANRGLFVPKLIVARTGLHKIRQPSGDSYGFLLGDSWLPGPGCPEAFADPRFHDHFAGAYEPAGTLEAWAQKWLELRNAGGPFFRWLVGAAFAPPLLGLLGQKTFITHIWNDSGVGKCVTADTLISTSSGLQHIADLDRPTYGEGFNEIPLNRRFKVWNGEKFVEPTHFYKSRGKVLRVRTTRGHEITGTPEHPMMTKRGWVRLDQLQIGVDELKTAPPATPEEQHLLVSPAAAESFETVTSVESLDGVVPVYDLTIPDGHAFWTNGLISHNTASGKFLMSIWGNPNKLMRSLNMTENAMVETFRYTSDLPSMFDELQMLKNDRAFLIYAVSGQKGKARATKTGGLQEEVKDYRSIIFTTGEEPIIQTKDLKGQSNRVVEIKMVHALPEARALHGFVAENYGHAGRLFLALVVLPAANDPEALLRLRARFDAMKAEIIRRTGCMTEHVNSVAIGAQAQYYAESYLLGVDAAEAERQALDDACEVIRGLPSDVGRSVWDRAIRTIQDHMTSNAPLYVDARDAGTPQRMAATRGLVGIKMEEGVALIPTEITAILSREPHSLPERRVWSDLADKGLLVVEKTNTTTRNQVTRKLPDGSWRRVYLVRWAAFEDQALALSEAIESAAAGDYAGAPEYANVLDISEMISRKP